LLSDEESILSSTVGSESTFPSPLTCRSPPHRPSPLAAPSTTPLGDTACKPPSTPHSGAASASTQRKGSNTSLCPTALLNNSAVARSLDFNQVSKRELNSLLSEYLDGWVDDNEEEDPMENPFSIHHGGDVQSTTGNNTNNNHTNNDNAITNDKTINNTNTMNNNSDNIFLGDGLNDFLNSSANSLSLNGGSYGAGDIPARNNEVDSDFVASYTSGNPSRDPTNQLSDAGDNQPSDADANQPSTVGVNQEGLSHANVPHPFPSSAVVLNTFPSSAVVPNSLPSSTVVPNYVTSSAAVPHIATNRRVTRSVTASQGAVARKDIGGPSVAREAEQGPSHEILDCSTIRVEIQMAQFSAHQLAVLRRQMVEHVQLLATSIMLCCNSAGNQPIADCCLHLLRSLNTQGKEHQLPGGCLSFFHAPNLLPAFAAVARLHHIHAMDLTRRRSLFLRGLCVKCCVEPQLISERTRSKLPLSNTPLEVLESQLVPPDVTPDLYYEGPPKGEKEWLDFLQDLVKTQLGGEDCRDEDNVQEDPDFDLFQDNDIAFSDIKEELRKDKAVKVVNLLTWLCPDLTVVVVAHLPNCGCGCLLTVVVVAHPTVVVVAHPTVVVVA
ncbi:hypothetical protein FHG87_023445, partial [Trinorchestia longiramus]